MGQHLGEGHISILHFTAQRIGLEIDWKLNEFTKQALKPKTRQQGQPTENLALTENEAQEGLTLNMTPSQELQHLRMIDEVTETHLMQNPVHQAIILTSRIEFVKKPKFRIYSRLLCEIINQLCESDLSYLVGQGHDLINSILFRPSRPAKPLLSCFELRFSMVDAIMRYFKARGTSS